MATTRVHLLAKDLGVKSKGIIEKCQAEGLDVKNHMSTISAGLAATIREWFSEGAHTTTIETAAPVDLKKVRVRKKKQTEKKPKAKKAAEAAEEAQQTAAAQAKAVQTEEPATAKPEPVVKPPIIIVEPLKPAGPVAPAGPKLGKPKPAKLSGPKVIRVEKTEVIERPRPRLSKPAYKQQATEPLMASASGIAEAKKTDKGKKKTHGRRHDEAFVSEEALREQKAARKLRERDLEERRARLDAAGGEGMRLRPKRKLETKRTQFEEALKVRPEKAIVIEPIMVKDLAAVLVVKTSEIVQKLIAHGIMAVANQIIPTDVAELIAIDLGTELVVQQKLSIEQQISEEFANRPKNDLQKRPAVVTMLGHVDHGKTSLLDKIRSAQVAAGEAGGITQHIGAHQVTWGDKNNPKRVTFLDTPGHEAFTEMRARGANMTDIVVLVVAADDGIMPQTIEAIHHAKAAGVHIIVALNKIDLPGVDTNRIYGQLAEHELAPTEWGGKTDVVKTSATKGTGIEELLEHLDFATELLDLKADPTVPAIGWVVEARLNPTKGPMATLLIKEGKLKKGDILLAGTGYGRIRTLKDSTGKSINTAVSSMPVEVSGLNDVPHAGDKFYCLNDINRAKAAAEEKKSLSRKAALATRSLVTMENLFSRIEAGKTKEVNIIVRADVQGSVDVLEKYLTDISTEEVQVKILHAAVGGITEGDVVLAEASGALVIGFNVVPEDKAAKTAESKGVDISLYNVIYKIADDLKKAMSGMLEPEDKVNGLGKAVVRNTFKVSSVGTIAGCYVEQGEVLRNAKIRLIRDNIVLRDNCQIESLKHFKDDVRQVRAGLECGIKIAGFDDIKIGDTFEVYEVVKVQRTL
ncbi:MAG: translation initiation factor IF-2 [Planctomycetes bacterium]|nr:translation initiation factor IF-2 [Planctomycetota bacterium]MBU1517926.1 translation initiation factor IF-2 [Planctomycetota bacterium]MBU2458181.1 translation initiation factor IF-2 [Planctomycetota bacterium]MBU2596304.1 translation initiation factor IF-2 [Planctomycetota bacterium]